MTRSVDEWFGATDDTRPPPHVRLRVLKSFNERCPKCTRDLSRNRWDCDHIVALANSGQNRESNLQPLCVSPCHSDKTRADRKLKVESDNNQKRSFGIKGNRSFTQWRRLNGDRVTASRER